MATPSAGVSRRRDVRAVCVLLFGALTFAGCDRREAELGGSIVRLEVAGSSAADSGDGGTDPSLDAALEHDAAMPDAATPHATTADAMPNAAMPNAAMPNAATPHATTADAMPDAATPHATTADAMPDGAMPVDDDDAGSELDAALPDAALPEPDPADDHCSMEIPRADASARANTCD